MAERTVRDHSCFRFVRRVTKYDNTRLGTVLLHLYAAALFRWRQQHRQQCTATHTVPTPAPPTNICHPAATSRPILSLYIAPLSPFDELETFIAASEQRYALSLFRVTPPPGEGEGMKYALSVYKTEFPHIEAILVGTRRGDPHGGSSFVYS